MRTDQTLCFAIATALFASSGAGAADTDQFSAALGNGTVYANLNMRYESVEQANALEDATAVTLRTRLGYRTGDFKGFSALIEVEDSRVVAGQGDYTVGPTGYNSGTYSVIADPETTEIDQGLLQYRNELLTVNLGRQVITFDGQRFVGHVGWRQDRQSFDGLAVKYTPMNKVTLNYAFVQQRNRIFAEAADVNASDHFLNASYVTPLGKAVGYAYLLETDSGTSNGLDTYGVSFRGARQGTNVKFLYGVELATQEASGGPTTFDTTYLQAEGGMEFAALTIKLGYELLGSDGGQFGFSTPLATLHKFNGWTDQFLTTPAVGLEDVYVSVGGKLAGGRWLLTYHDFSADSASATVDDLGSEIDVQLTRKFADKYTLGLKYATYDAGDTAAGNVDTDKLWAWFNIGF